MQADRPVAGNLIEYWMGGVRRGFNRFILYFILLPLGFGGGVLAAWLIGRKAFRPVAWGSIFVLAPLGTPPLNLLLVRVLGEWVVPHL
jgi:hypothetical protein